MIKLVIFDLDGVIVSTDELHYQAWKRIAEQETIPFDRNINNRLRGVSRKESLEIILSYSPKQYTKNQKEVLMEQKNAYYVSSLKDLTSQDILPGVTEVLKELKQRKIKVSIASSSKNARLILKQIGLLDVFDSIVDGNMIIHSKPHPEVFQQAAQALKVPCENALVVEDARSGIDGALKANMLAIGIGDAARYDKCHFKILALNELIPILEKISVKQCSRHSLKKGEL